MLQRILFISFIFTLSLPVFGQTTEINRYEVNINYSNNQVETGFSNNSTTSPITNSGGALRRFFDKRENFNGFEVSGVGNINRFVGIKGDFSATFKDFDIVLPNTPANTVSSFQVESALLNFLGGVQIKDNRKDGSRLRPFGHAMVGVAHGRSKVDNAVFTSPFCSQPGVNCQLNFKDSDTGFAAAIGGGLDVRATNRFSIRAFQVDYNPTHLFGFTQDNVRFGIGVVIH